MSARTRRRRRHLSVWPAVALWALLMAPLMRWGLPSRAQDDLLFGGAPAWTAERYSVAADLGALRRRDTGADTDLNPLANRDQIIELTTDEAARAEILRRYRLYSRQPDEMITFRALQRMSPRAFDFDPRLYQYGGGYIYLIGGVVAASSLTGIVQLASDVGMYLEQPELFARFYIVARIVTLVFGALLLVAVWKLARRAAGHAAGWLALVLVACTPVFITGVLEAKPHIPSACLLLWAALSALNYHARGRGRDALWLGLQAGYAFGLVLTGLVVAAIWPVLLVARWPAVRYSTAGRRQLLGHLAAAAGLALLVYLLTNPYIPYNYLFNRAALASNIDNSTAMYADQMRQAGAGAGRVGQFLLESCGPGLIIVGLVGFAGLLRRRPRETLIVASAGLALLVICILLGAGKPAEYARFLVLPVCLLGVAGGGLLAAAARPRRRLALLVGCLVILLMKTPVYVRSFVTDADGVRESRHAAAGYLRDHAADHDAIAVLQEPAPYAVPPLDFAHGTVLWLPATRPAELVAAGLPRWLVFTADDDAEHRDAWWRAYYGQHTRFPPAGTAVSRIAWADKPVFLYVRLDQPPPPAPGP